MFIVVAELRKYKEFYSHKITFLQTFNIQIQNQVVTQISNLAWFLYIHLKSGS